jgi:hypothetical protein
MATGLELIGKNIKYAVFKFLEADPADLRGPSGLLGGRLLHEYLASVQLIAALSVASDLFVFYSRIWTRPSAATSSATWSRRGGRRLR